MSFSPPLISIGGIGGSGTRLVATILSQLGFYLGNDLNEAKDNQWFTLLFKRINLLNSSTQEFKDMTAIFTTVMTSKKILSTSQIDFIHSLVISADKKNVKWTKEVIGSILSPSNRSNQSSQWGWKEPNTHIVIDRLQTIYPNLKYIHVIRNGLDMAYSNNQRQLSLWGSHFLGQEIQITPYFSLKFWCVMHKRIIKMGGAMGKNFLLLNYEQLCNEPKRHVSDIVNFLNIEVSEKKLDLVISHTVKPAKSQGRYKQYNLSDFDQTDIDYVSSLGFEVEI